MKVSFNSALEGLRLLRSLYPHIATCGSLVDNAFLDGVINLSEAQYLNHAPVVWFDFLTESLDEIDKVG